MGKYGEKYCCPVCKIQPIYDSEGKPLAGESIKCECCNIYVCGTCGYTDEDRYTMHENGHMPEYLYSTFLTDDFICCTCMTNAEKDYIDEVPLEYLPLYVNHEWFDEKNEEYFKKKFQNI